jgi:uncharacterized protein (TIGR02246 family)
MSDDETAIRKLIEAWHTATANGDVDGVLRLMAEDVVFLVSGQPPMRGRDAFENALRNVLASHQIESTGTVQEVRVSGDLAYCWTVLNVRVTPATGGPVTTRAGSALSILVRRDGTWVLLRDANLLSLVD